MTDPVWLVSIHDVMPDTMNVVKSTVARLDSHNVAPLTLLVVPGGNWSTTDIEWLRQRQDQGDRLAGHGWIHRAGKPRGLYDRLHRRFFSRGVAEHLSLSTSEISSLIEKCHNWFVSQGLVSPDLYVPPAWAMGRISRQLLRDLPFGNYELLSGIYDSTNDQFRRVPLVGFEADTRFRALSLRLSNAINHAAAKWYGRLRVAIHPNDLELMLRDDLEKLIANPASCAAYNSVNMSGTTLDTAPPAFTPDQALQVARKHFGLNGEIRSLVSERDQNFLVQTEDDKRYVLKIANPAEDPKVVDFQVRVLRHLATINPTLPLPRVRQSLAGLDIVEAVAPGQPHSLARVVSFLDGVPLADIEEVGKGLWREQGKLLAQLGHALRGFFHPAAGHQLLWDMKYALGLREFLPAIADSHQRNRVDAVLNGFETHALPVLPHLRAQVIHNDLNPGNLLVDPDDPDRITGIIDFGDLVYSPLVIDLAVAAAYQLAETDNPLEPAGDLVRAYHQITALEDDELEILFDLITTRVATSVAISSWRAARYPENAEYILTSNPRAVRMLDRLAKIPRSEAADFFRKICAMPTRTTPAPESDKELISRRDRLLGPAYRLFYDQPLHFVRAKGVWLYDPAGRPYLDAYNNVAQVGHCHPHVVEAISRQTARLNTHTRYLHQTVVDYAERLGALFPFEDPVCLFCCTGSEANELAYRIAQAYTGGTGVLVTPHAYHGNTSTVSQFSTSDTPPERRGTFVRTITAPDSYRVAGDSQTTSLAEYYAADVTQAIRQLLKENIQPAMLLIDTIFSCDGVITPPETYLAQSAQQIRQAGGLLVADEVQAGFGRTGDYLWGFERHGVVPDIVTLGKPMGNGYPIAAVVCPRKIVAAFADQIDYFNTFGGNPVACAAGTAVLDVLETEGLQENARDIGTRLRESLLQLQAQNELIGNVRGSGLFIGVELVCDRNSQEPARKQASIIVNTLRQEGVLIGATGPCGNVLKIRPPLVFSRQNADQLIETLQSALRACHD